MKTEKIEINHVLIEMQRVDHTHQAVFFCENTPLHIGHVKFFLLGGKERPNIYRKHISSTYFGPCSVPAVAYTSMLEMPGPLQGIDGSK